MLGKLYEVLRVVHLEVRMRVLKAIGTVDELYKIHLTSFYNFP